MKINSERIKGHPEIIGEGLAKLDSKIRKLKEQNKELRESLAALVAEYEGYFEGAEETKELITARAVLEKHKGKE